MCSWFGLNVICQASLVAIGGSSPASAIHLPGISFGRNLVVTWLIHMVAWFARESSEIAAVSLVDMHLCKKITMRKNKVKNRKKNIVRDMWQYIQERMEKKQKKSNLLSYYNFLLNVSAIVCWCHQDGRQGWLHDHPWPMGIHWNFEVCGGDILILVRVHLYFVS
jgi:hypothetical protein